MTNKAKGKREKSPLAVIRKAVEEAKKAGYTIVYGGWGAEWDTDTRCWRSIHGYCCPLGAVLLVHQPTSVGYGSRTLTVAGYLGVSPYWVRGFYAAIDREPLSYLGHEEKSGYRAGVVFRKKWGRKTRSLRSLAKERCVELDA
ncbi:MAG: hypothetical protein KatS3mg109_1329 [Pirellulaceae bacterium]|nr:MAG: hypothetical protein KatS3mg109_1329 [Pirellulaceae bacterium]